MLYRIAKQVDKMEVMLRHKEFNDSDPIIILSFLAGLRMVFNTSTVHEGATVWIIPYFLGKKPRRAY